MGGGGGGGAGGGGGIFQHKYIKEPMSILTLATNKKQASKQHRTDSKQRPQI